MWNLSWNILNICNWWDRYERQGKPLVTQRKSVVNQGVHLLLSIAMSFGTFTASKKKYIPSLCKQKELQIILRIYLWLQLNYQRPLRTCGTIRARLDNILSYGDFKTCSDRFQVYSTDTGIFITCSSIAGCNNKILANTPFNTDNCDDKNITLRKRLPSAKESLTHH